jgi:hypothetical protein
MTAASDAMGERLRPLLKGLVEKKMFGGLGFMLNGNMLVGTTAKGRCWCVSIPARWTRRSDVPAPPPCTWATR